MIDASQTDLAFSVGPKIALDYITNQPPFSCDETRKQPLSAAPKIPRKDREEIEEATASLAAAKRSACRSYSGCILGL